jgi:hypothetical protein
MSQFVRCERDTRVGAEIRSGRSAATGDRLFVEDILRGIYNVTGNILGAANGILNLAGRPLGDTVGLQFRIAQDQTKPLLHRALELVTDAFKSIFIHGNISLVGVSLPPIWRPRIATPDSETTHTNKQTILTFISKKKSIPSFLQARSRR